MKRAHDTPAEFKMRQPALGRIVELAGV